MSDRRASEAFLCTVSVSLLCLFLYINNTIFMLLIYLESFDSLWSHTCLAITHLVQKFRKKGKNMWVKCRGSFLHDSSVCCVCVYTVLCERGSILELEFMPVRDTFICLATPPSENHQTTVPSWSVTAVEASVRGILNPTFSFKGIYIDGTEPNVKYGRYFSACRSCFALFFSTYTYS